MVARDELLVSPFALITGSTDPLEVMPFLLTLLLPPLRLVVVVAADVRGLVEVLLPLLPPVVVLGDIAITELRSLSSSSSAVNCPSRSFAFISLGESSFS